MKWIKTDLPRSAFGQVLLYSFGAAMTFCQVKRNDAEARVRTIIKTGADPQRGVGRQERADTPPKEELLTAEAESAWQDLAQTAQDLLVSWGGFTGAVHKEATQSFFHLRLWDSGDLIEALFKNYEGLPEEIQAQMPLKRIWTLAVAEET